MVRLEATGSAADAAAVSRSGAGRFGPDARTPAQDGPAFSWLLSPPGRVDL